MTGGNTVHYFKHEVEMLRFPYFFLHRNGGATKLREMFTTVCWVLSNVLKVAGVPPKTEGSRRDSFAALPQPGESAERHVTSPHRGSAQGNQNLQW